MRKNLLLAAMIAALAFAGVACSDDDTAVEDEGTGTEVEDVTTDEGAADEGAVEGEAMDEGTTDDAAVEGEAEDTE